MKTLFALIAMTFAASPAFAVMKKVGSFDQYYFNFETSRPMTLTVTVKHSTKDGCNQFFLDGDIRRQEVPAGTQTLAQDFVADVSVMSTMMGCQQLEQPRELLLKAKPFVVEPVNGWVTGSVLVPAGAKVTLE